MKLQLYGNEFQIIFYDPNFRYEYRYKQLIRALIGFIYLFISLFISFKDFHL